MFQVFELFIRPITFLLIIVQKPAFVIKFALKLFLFLC